jgi:hypothetical protein
MQLELLYFMAANISGKSTVYCCYSTGQREITFIWHQTRTQRYVRSMENES